MQCSVNAVLYVELVFMPAMSLEGLPCAWLGVTWPQLRTGFHGGMGGEEEAGGF